MNQLLNFGKNLNKDLDDVDKGLNNFKELMKKKQKLDKRHQIFYGGKANSIFPDLAKLEKLGPLKEKEKVIKGVKFESESESFYSD